MLEKEILDQLKNLFGELHSEIGFAISKSNHLDQNLLIELIDDVTKTSPKLKFQILNQESLVPSFYLTKNEIKTGISFSGIPTGHEFSSLVLAILNIDGKGKLPDLSMQKRIKRLKGPIKIKTYISLSCENCPDVVQALNQLSLIHENFQHEMIDGAYVQNEISEFGIQGVPSIMDGSKLIHSGKIQFLDLLKTLEENFGTKNKSERDGAEEEENKELGLYDVLILGGGPAGSAAAIYSARKGLKTAIVAEKFGGQVQDTKGIENFISLPYTVGPELSSQLYKHVSSYPVDIFENRRVVSVDKDLRKLNLDDGSVIHYKSLIVTTGAKWREMNVPGEKEYKGRGVAFCPHCDGPYYKGKKVAVIGGGNSGVEAAIDLSGIVKEVVLLEFSTSLKADKVLIDKMNSISNISYITSAQTTQVIGNGSKVTGIEYKNRLIDEVKNIELEGVFVQIGLLPNSQFLGGVVELNKSGEIIVDEKGRTKIEGIYAAGDVTNTPYKQIIIAMGEGAKVALTAFEDLTMGTSSKLFLKL